MTDLYIEIPKNGFHFAEAGIKKIEEMKNAKYMGFWALRTAGGGWSEEPVDIFYVENPDRSLGHTNYFGMFTRSYMGEASGKQSVYITCGDSAFSEPIVGIKLSSGKVIVSRYRHDYVTEEDAMIDGGRDYTRRNLVPQDRIVFVTVRDGKFEFTPADMADHNPATREWEYDGTGAKVYKGTNKPYTPPEPKPKKKTSIVGLFSGFGK